MNILIINCGSSSIKYQLLNMSDSSLMASGIAERIGEPNSILSHVKLPGTQDEYRTVIEKEITDHQVGMTTVLALLTDSRSGVISDISEIRAIGHRVVHGGESFRTPIVITKAVINKIHQASSLAPLHNPANLMGIDVARTMFPDAPHVAVFDTAFHQTIPPYAFHYALPYEFYEDLGVRRYGFHGTSHQYVAKEAAILMGRSLEQINLVTVHLGGGASICAIKNGKSMDTSMGMTPLGGMIMGTRGGNLDPGVLIYIAAEKGYNTEQLDHVLQKESGLKGICGSNDMRDIHARSEKGDSQAQLAFDMFVYRCRQYIGAYFLELGQVDALIFTAGIGENDPITRAKCCENLEGFGINIDTVRNASDVRKARCISVAESPVSVWVIPTNEELEIARQTMEVLNTS